MLIEVKQDSQVSFGEAERPKYRALNDAIQGMYRDLLRPLERLEATTFMMLGLPRPKAESFRYTAAMRRVLDEAMDLYLAEIAGPDRSREGFVNGGPDADTPDGVLQQWQRFSFAVGLRRGADLVDRPQTISAERNSPATRQMLDNAFTRLSEGGTLKLERVRDEVHSILTSATQAGLSPLETGRQLAGLYSDYNRVQFERLARTESAFAAEEASRLQMADLGVTHVTWLISANACPICQSFVGLVIPIEDVDRQPPGASHPNCLCSTVPATAEDAEAAQQETIKTQTGEEAAQSILDLDARIPDEIREENLRIQARENDLYEEHSATMRQRTQARLAGDHETADSLTPRLESLSSELEALAKQREEVRQSRLERLRSAVAVEDPISVGVSFDKGARFPQGRSVIQEGVREFERLVSQQAAPSVDTVGVKRLKKRSHYDLNGNIVLDAVADKRVVIHELGHWLEDFNPRAHDAALRFLDRRTQGESLTRMRDLFPGQNFDASEVTRPDQFIHPYTGKEYISNGRRYASEVISMGLEQMWKDPADFARRDPDHFAFIWDLTRGRYRG